MNLLNIRPFGRVRFAAVNSISSTGNAPENFLVRSFVRSLVAKIVGGVQIFEKKRLGPRDHFRQKIIETRDILAMFKPFEVWRVGKATQKHPYATFWRIRLIVLGFMRIRLQFAQIQGRSAKFAQKWRFEFSRFEDMMMS